MNFFLTLRIAWRALNKNKMRAGLTVLGVVIGIAAITVSTRSMDSGLGNGFQQTSAWIASHTDSGAVIMAQRHLDFQLVADRPGAVFPVSGDRNLLVEAMVKTRARFLVVYDTPVELAYYFPLERDRLARIKGVLHDRLVQRIRDQDITIFEVLPAH